MIHDLLKFALKTFFNNNNDPAVPLLSLLKCLVEEHYLKILFSTPLSDQPPTTVSIVHQPPLSATVRQVGGQGVYLQYVVVA